MKSFYARVGFRDRQTAERAFLNCKSWQGHNLQFAWVPSAGHVKANTNTRSSDNPSAADEPSESHRQSAEKAAPTPPGELVDGESEDLERERSAVHANPAEASQPVPTSVPGGKAD